MTTIKDFLYDLKNQDIQLWLDGDSLRCNAPKGSLTAELRTELANRKAEIIVYLQQHHSEPKIIPVNRDTNIPLSYAQARLWFLEQLESGKSTNYNLPNHLKIVGSLNTVALEQSLGEIVRRHEILRTNFRQVNGLPIQVINPKITFTLPVIELQNLLSLQQSAEVEKLINEDNQKPFNLANDPLIRTTLLQLGHQYYILLLTFHHIVFDAWSAGIFIKELSSLYQAKLQKLPSPLPDLPIQYADFAVWQQQWLSGEVLETQLNYWKEQLANLPPLLELPTDKPRYLVQTDRGSKQKFTLNFELTQKLKDLSRQSGTTLFMILLAAFATLLHRYSAQEDIVIGSPAANRNQQETESLIGFFVNTLVLRIGLENNPTFLELLGRVRQVTLAAYEYQDIPFEKLVEALQPVRNLSHSPLFQVMFSVQKEAIGQLELPDITLTPVPTSLVTETFDLSLLMLEMQTGLEGYWEYNSDLFDNETVARIAINFQTLLEDIVKNPTKPVSELSLLTEKERYQLLVEWNATQTEIYSHKCIHELITAQAERTPDAIAVETEDATSILTYRQLNERANQLAKYLQSLGIKPETLVGICTERSLEMIVGLLGILKAGGAYIPLDPQLPPERLVYILSDSQIEILLTQEKLKAKLPEHQCITICLDTNWVVINQQSKENPVSEVNLNNLAYTIYTSGSTGKPKGVMIEHLALMNFVTVATKEYGITYQDRFLQFASISFDTSVQEIYPCLSVGGTVVLRTEEMLLSSDDFWQHCRDWQLTVLDLPTAYWHQLTTELSTADPRIPECLRLVIIGGEEAKLEYVQRWKRGVSHLSHPPQLVNGYGPTEATVMTSFYFFSDKEEISVPIGRPIGNTQMYVLDKYLQPVPVGVPGHLHIGGVDLARGYLHRPELTAQKFIPNPFDNSKSARLYKTGDLVYYRPDGNLEFLGRVDNQVKIRGFRIELGEIETVLMQHPQVQATVVMVREDQPGDKRLVAYIIPHSNQSSIHELRQFLKQQLPDYMVPAAWMMLDAFPLTNNGKIDYRALTAPTQELSSSHNLVTPRTPTQELIVDIIAIVLRRERVGIHDNFFELGGHSLLAMQVISRLRETFKVDLPLRCLFESPTVAELAEAILKEQQGSGKKLAPAIIPRPRNTAQIPLSFVQSRLWFLNQLEGISGTYNIAVALQITGNLNIKALEQAIQKIVERHEILRTYFHSINGSPVQVIDPKINVTLSVVDVQDDSTRDKQLQDLVTTEALRPFNLAKDALVRAKLWRLDSQKYVLLLAMHHIVFDGWSMGIFTQELSILYQAFATGHASPLPELPIQYADYAVWQRQWLNGQVLAAQLNYWQQQLAAPPLLELPTDKPRPAVQTFRGSGVVFQLDADLSRQLKVLSQKSATTLFMTLLAAFACLLSRYSGQDDILIGSPVANRNRQEIESLIGFFVNTLVLRTKIPGNLQFSELLTQVRQVALEAYAHQDVPFEQIVETLQPERNFSYNPLFQVMFDLENAATEQLELPGLHLKPLGIGNVTAKFDLSLFMRETQLGLEGYWEYNSDLFDNETIARMARNFQTLLEGIVASPDRRLWELPILTAAERYQLLVEWNDTQKDYPKNESVQQLFESFVDQTPHAVALVFENQQLTYQELNRCANQLAHYLQKLGVGPEVLVGICAERSVEMIVGLLGILKAGGAYVPLDPSYPQERRKFMLQDAQIPVLLTQEKFVKDFPDFSNPIIYLDNHWEIIAQESEENLSCSVKPDNLAYVIYTSGSTGEPKGVAVAHRAVNRLVCNTNYVKLERTDKIAQVANTSFDAATFEIWGALLNGAQLVVISKNVTLSPHEFALELQQKGISVLFLTTALFQQIARDVPQAFASLRYLLFGGETVDPRWVQEVPKNGSRSQLLHVYGPTESTTFSSYYCVQELPESATSIPIGRPITNRQIYLLDAHLQPVPIGVVGELYIGGDGLARGYFNRPELTAKKFISNPFSHEEGAYLYKTGDLARYLPNGNIQFLGRVDHQVKIRGFRIELGEIETVLSQHPDVKETVVIAQSDYPSNKRLVAYVVPQQEKPEHIVTINALLRFLKQKLPEYMMPSTFLLLDALPLTPNGKIDRRALPVPSRTQLKDKKEIVAPRTLTEEMLARIWAEVLGIESYHRGSSEINIYDNFFELGGHSLVATVLITRIRQVFQVDLPLWRLFESSTIAGLAEGIETERQTNIGWHQTKLKTGSTLVPIQIGGSKRPFFIVPGGVGGEFELITYAKLVYELGQEQPVYGLQARGWDGKQKPHTQVEVMAADYIQQIRTIQPEGPYLLGGECIGGIVAFEMARQLQAQGQKLGLLVLMDTQLPSYIQKLGYFLQRIISKVKRVGRIRYHLTKLLQLNSGLRPDTFNKIRKAKDLLVEQSYRTVLIRYRPRTYKGRITLLVNEDNYQQNPSMGWDYLATGGLEIHKIPGNHDSYLGEYVQTTAEKLKACLDAAQADD